LHAVTRLCPRVGVKHRLRRRGISARDPDICHGRRDHDLWRTAGSAPNRCQTPTRRPRGFGAASLRVV